MAPAKMLHPPPSYILNVRSLSAANQFHLLIFMFLPSDKHAKSKRS